MNSKKRNYYFLGLFVSEKLIIENDYTFTYEILLDNRKVVVKDKVMKLYKSGYFDTNYVEIDDNEINRDVTRQLNEDGSRWEGDWYNKQPFGFGSLYDGEGNRIYSGFMFEGKKIGFGTEYFADNHKVDYCGNFYE